MQPTDPSKLTAQQPPGQPAADDHAPMGPPPAETIARGYEVDAFDAKSVISVPLLVVLFFVLAFGTVTIIFKFIAYPNTPVNPQAHPAIAKHNKETLNKRMASISRSKDGDQPRLEPLKLRDPSVRGKDSEKYDLTRAITRPDLPEGNSPEIHPEALRATKEHYPALYATGGKDNKLGIDKAMGLPDATLKALFPVQASASKPAQSQHFPTAANAGRGAEESVVETPPVPKTEAKKDALPKIPTAPEPPKANPEPPKTPEPPKKQ